MASFQAKTGQDSLRNRKKIIIPINSTRPGIKNSKKIEKIKKHHYVFISRQNGSGVAKKR